MILNVFLPTTLYNFLAEIEELGFSLCLVGGAVRDHYAENKLSHDLDFEIRSTKKNVEWNSQYEILIRYFEAHQLKVIRHPYLISKVEYAGFSLEFSSPRTETYNEEIHSHHNFEAILSSELTYKESFRRRDFTVNAIGLELDFKNNSMSLVDPFNGLEDLKAKRLRAIDQDFFKDSVRFLRLIRFKIKYGMNIDPAIENDLEKFNLTGLSKYHFTSEMFKCDTGSFLNSWQEFILNYNLVIPIDFNIWNDSEINWPINILQSKDDLLIYVYLKKQKSAQLIQSFFSLPEKMLKDLDIFINAHLQVEKLTKEDAREILKDKTHDFYKILKIVDEKNIWLDKIKKIQPDFAGIKKIKFDIKISEEQLNTEKNANRSQLKYFMALKNWVQEND